MPNTQELDRRLALLLGRIENELTRHKRAHESHLHWAIVLFGATVALVSKSGLEEKLWPVAVVALTLNVALWFRAARAYRSLDAHWHARDLIYASLKSNGEATRFAAAYDEVSQWLNGTTHDRRWRQGAIATIIAVGVPEFLLLTLGHCWFLWAMLREKPGEFLKSLMIAFALCIVVFFTSIVKVVFKLSFRYK